MSKAIFWFRQDLRFIDNPGLFHACQNHDEILYLYILDDEHLYQKAQAWWLHHSLTNLQKKNSIGTQAWRPRGYFKHTHCGA